MATELRPRSQRLRRQVLTSASSRMLLDRTIRTSTSGTHTVRHSAQRPATRAIALGHLCEPRLLVAPCELVSPLLCSALLCLCFPAVSPRPSRYSLLRPLLHAQVSGAEAVPARAAQSALRHATLPPKRAFQGATSCGTVALCASGAAAAAGCGSRFANGAPCCI